MDDAERLIDVQQVTRRFPRCVALAGVSFSVNRGETVALLGPNGSGKTTTLRIAAGGLAPSTGSVRIAGFDTLTQWMDVRRRIGYLPEQVPLYPEMRVVDYLRFRGKLHGLRGTRLAGRLRDCMDQCGLGDASRRIIGTLSRGYRQRTGLADCLLHRPDVLLLDEPTSGLDPGQSQSVRDVLRDLGRHCAILFSTHILTEAEDLCQRVVVLTAGRLAAADSPEGLRETYATRTLEEAYLRLTTLPPLVRNPTARSSE